jgi:hypothetical protein
MILFLVRGIALAKTLPGSAACNLRLQTASFSGFQIKRVLLGIGDNSLAGNLSFKASYRALYTLVIVNLNLCHSRPPIDFIATQ